MCMSLGTYFGEKKLCVQHTTVFSRPNTGVHPPAVLAFIAD